MLNEAVTKTAQFSEIVRVLVDGGAGLSVVDNLGNTPLHNAVLYHPSTQQTVDLLLERGADAGAKNYEGSTPMALADDKDLKIVLKELKKAAWRKKSEGSTVPYSNSPEMRRKVFDRQLMDERFKQRIIVRYNTPVVTKSPGLLKRKRKQDEFDEKFGGRRKRIKWCFEQDVHSNCSDEEKHTEQEDVENDNSNIEPSNESIISHHDNYIEKDSMNEVEALSSIHKHGHTEMSFGYGVEKKSVQTEQLEEYHSDSDHTDGGLEMEILKAPSTTDNDSSVADANNLNNMEGCQSKTFTNSYSSSEENNCNLSMVLNNKLVEDTFENKADCYTYEHLDSIAHDRTAKSNNDAKELNPVSEAIVRSEREIRVDKVIHEEDVFNSSGDYSAVNDLFGENAKAVKDEDLTNKEQVGAQINRDEIVVEDLDSKLHTPNTEMKNNTGICMTNENVPASDDFEPKQFELVPDISNLSDITNMVKHAGIISTFTEPLQCNLKSSVNKIIEDESMNDGDISSEMDLSTKVEKNHENHLIDDKTNYVTQNQTLMVEGSGEAVLKSAEEETIKVDVDENFRTDLDTRIIEANDENMNREKLANVQEILTDINRQNTLSLLGSPKTMNHPLVLNYQFENCNENLFDKSIPNTKENVVEKEASSYMDKIESKNDDVSVEDHRYNNENKPSKMTDVSCNTTLLHSQKKKVTANSHFQCGDKNERITKEFSAKIEFVDDLQTQNCTVKIEHNGESQNRNEIEHSDLESSELKIKNSIDKSITALVTDSKEIKTYISTNNPEDQNVKIFDNESPSICLQNESGKCNQSESDKYVANLENVMEKVNSNCDLPTFQEKNEEKSNCQKIPSYHIRENQSITGIMSNVNIFSVSDAKEFVRQMESDVFPRTLQQARPRYVEKHNTDDRIEFIDKTPKIDQNSQDSAPEITDQSQNYEIPSESKKRVVSFGQGFGFFVS